MAILCKTMQLHTLVKISMDAVGEVSANESQDEDCDFHRVTNSMGLSPS
jgi:hypothetical protein